MRRLLMAVSACLLLAAAPAHAHPGDLDRTFGNGGRVASKLFGEGGIDGGMALPDGVSPLLSVGTSARTGFKPAWLRLTADGKQASVDPIPPPAWFAPSVEDGYALASTPIGTGTRGRYLLYRLDGAQPVTITIPAPYYTAAGFDVDASGRLVIIADGQIHETIALRYLPTGELDPSYGTNGVARLRALDYGSLVAVKRDGRAYFSDGNRIAALDANGQPSTGVAQGYVFTPGGRISENGATLLADGPGETLLVAGRGWVGRLRVSGRRDTRFGKRGIVFRQPVVSKLNTSAIARDSHGRLVLAGLGTGKEAGVIRLSARGVVDRSFASRGLKVFRLGFVSGVKIVASQAKDVAIDKRGRIVVAGEVYDDTYFIREDFGQPYPAIARLKG